MPYHHETGSMRRYSGGYGTIDITLSNYSNLVSGTRYDYSLQKTEGGLYKGYAIAEDNGSEIVLVDSSFTLPNNPPPYQTGTEINIFNSSDGEFVLNTYISSIENHGEKDIFKFDMSSSDFIEEEFVSTSDFGPSPIMIDDVSEPQRNNEIRPGVIETPNGLVYPDGVQIPSPPLNESYRLSNSVQRCGNCLFFNAGASYCGKFQAGVRQSYVCRSWKEIEDMENQYTTMGVEDSFAPPDSPPSEPPQEPVYETHGGSDTTEDSTVIVTELQEIVDDNGEWYNYVEDGETHHRFRFDVESVIKIQMNDEMETINEFFSDGLNNWEITVNQTLGEMISDYQTIVGTSGKFNIFVDPNSNGDVEFEILINYNRVIDGILTSQTKSFKTPVLSKTSTLDVGEEIEYFPIGSDGEVIIDEELVKRSVREKVYEGMYGEIINNQTISAQDILSFQQTIRDGAIAVGRGDDEILVFTKKDGNVLNQAGENIEDIINKIYVENINQIQTFQSNVDLKSWVSGINISYSDSQSPDFGTIFKITYGGVEVIYAKKMPEDGWVNVPNIPNINFINEFGNTIDISKAQETLDTNIYELLPFQRSRQNEVDELFTKLVATDFLGDVPQFNSDGSITDQSLANDSGSRVSENDNLNAGITRLDSQANAANENKSLQSLRNTLNLYLKDVDNVVENIDDERPTYQNKSEGFLKLRKPNQAIIIKSPDGGELDFQKNDSYLTDGFTVTMWVRFIGRTGNGTLFSYGNPYKKSIEDRYGFRLETFTVSRKDRYPDYPQDVGTSRFIMNNFPVDPPPFEYSDYERFVRLVVWDYTDDTPYQSGALQSDTGENGKLYDSHFGTPRKARQRLWDPMWNGGGGTQGHVGSGYGMGPDGTDDPTHYAVRRVSMPVYFPSDEYGVYHNGHAGAMHEFAFNYTRIPTDNLDEWFFICATYDPSVDETSDWQKYSSDGSYRCSVEVISKRDLLTARGYKVELAGDEELPATEMDDMDDMDDGGEEPVEVEDKPIDVDKEGEVNAEEAVLKEEDREEEELEAYLD